MYKTPVIFTLLLLVVTSCTTLQTNRYTNTKPIESPAVSKKDIDQNLVDQNICLYVAKHTLKDFSNKNQQPFPIISKNKISGLGSYFSTKHEDLSYTNFVQIFCYDTGNPFYMIQNGTIYDDILLKRVKLRYEKYKKTLALPVNG
jgi:hypothetical protein